MRDVRRMRERVEFRMERMRVIWLTLGGLVALALAFALGVVVGKRAERLAVAAAPSSDPVAQADADGDRHKELTFYTRLTSREAETQQPPARRSPAPVAPPVAPQPRSSVATAAENSAPPSAAVSDTSRPATSVPAARDADPSPPPQADSADTAGAPPAPPTAVAGMAPAREGETPAAQGERERAVAVAAAAPAVALAATPTAAPERELRVLLARHPRPGIFTVQVSAFQTSEEARAFAASLGRKGYPAFVVAARIPGKGTWYRVRMGSFADADTAHAAKTLLARSDIPAWVLRSD